MAGEGKMRTEGREEPRTDPGDPVEPGRAAKRPVGLAIRHDPLGERQTHPGEARQLGGRRPVGVDPLIGPQGAGQGEDAVPVGDGRAGREGGEKLDLARRVIRPGRPPADALAHEPQREQQDERATLGGGHGTSYRGGPGRLGTGLCETERRYFPSLRISATATSPTIPRLAALTLSMVSSLVCQ